MEIHWKSSRNFNVKHVEISMKYQWKSIENPVEISMKNGNPLELQLEFNSNFNGIPVWSILNQVEISIIIQWKFQWNTNRNWLEIQLKFNEIPMEIHWKSSWNFNWIPIEIHCKSSWILNEIPMETNWIPVVSIVNPVEISMIWKWKYQWNSNRNCSEIQLKFNEIPMKINWKSI